MNPIVVVGAGGHARVVADLIRLSGQFELHGFLDPAHPDRSGETYEGSQVLGGSEQLADLLGQGIHTAVIAVGDNHRRQAIAQQLAVAGFSFPALIHPRATVASSVQFGAGTVVFAGAIINAAAKVGSHVIINTAASVDHDSVLGDAVHIAPGAHLGGSVMAGDRALIGLGASIKPGVRIGMDAIVGVGAAVISDVAAGQTVAGVPARPQ